MKVRELIERAQTMEQDATVTVIVTVVYAVKGGYERKTDEVRIDGIEQHGAGMMATVRLNPEDELQPV